MEKVIGSQIKVVLIEIFEKAREQKEGKEPVSIKRKRKYKEYAAEAEREDMRENEELRENEGMGKNEEIEWMNNENKYIYVGTECKRLCEQFDMKKEIIITMLTQAEIISKEIYGESVIKFIGVLPARCSLYFYKYTPVELATENPLIKECLKISRKREGSHSFSMLKLAQNVRESPEKIVKNLFTLQTRGFLTYKLEEDCFCVKVEGIIDHAHISCLGEKVIRYIDQVEANTYAKLKATYILCRQGAYNNIHYMINKQKTDSEFKSQINRVCTDFQVNHDRYFNFDFNNNPHINRK